MGKKRIKYTAHNTSIEDEWLSNKNPIEKAVNSYVFKVNFYPNVDNYSFSWNLNKNQEMNPLKINCDLTTI